jgi:hypothetical protein
MDNGLNLFRIDRVQERIRDGTDARERHVVNVCSRRRLDIAPLAFGKCCGDVAHRRD